MAVKEKKVRCKEKSKEKKAKSQMENKAAPAAKEPTTPKNSIVPLVIGNISRPETRKRKNETEEEATNKRKTPTKAPAVKAPKVKPKTPKRKDVTKEQKPAL